MFAPRIAATAALCAALATATVDAVPPPLNAVARAVTGSLPKGVSISPDGRTLYVTNYGNANGRNVAVYDAATLQRTGWIDLRGVAVESVVSPDGHTLYVSDVRRGVVSFVSLPRGRVRREVRVHLGAEARVRARARRRLGAAQRAREHEAHAALLHDVRAHGAVARLEALVGHVREAHTRNVEGRSELRIAAPPAHVVDARHLGAVLGRRARVGVGRHLVGAGGRGGGG